MTATDELVKPILLEVAQELGGSYDYDHSSYGMGFRLSWYRPTDQRPPHHSLVMAIGEASEGIVEVGCALSKKGITPQCIFVKQLGRFKVKEVNVRALVIEAYDLLNQKYGEEVVNKNRRAA